MEQYQVKVPEIIPRKEEQLSFAQAEKSDENLEQEKTLSKEVEPTPNANTDNTTISSNRDSSTSGSSSSSISSESDEEKFKEELEELKKKLKGQSSHHSEEQIKSPAYGNDESSTSANNFNQLENNSLLDNLEQENDIEQQTIQNTIHNMEIPDDTNKDTRGDPNQFIQRNSSHEGGDTIENREEDERQDHNMDYKEDLSSDNVTSKEDTKETIQPKNNISADIDQLLIQLRVMTQENESLRDVIRNLRYNYDRAIVTLKDVETSFSQRDMTIEYYKQELAKSIQGNNVNVTKQNSTEGKEDTGLRNGLLDTRLQLERLKTLQTSKDTQETELNEKLEPIVMSLQQSQSECKELQMKVKELTEELTQARSQGQDHQRTENDIKDLRDALDNSNVIVKNLEELLESERKQKQAYETENELIVPLKEQVTSLEKDLDNVMTNLKVKDTKYKFTKKEVERLQNELKDSKVSAQNFPNLQLEVESLTVKNEELKHQIEEMNRNEANRLQNEKAQKQREAEQRRLEKDAWEKRIVLNNEKLYEIVQQSEHKINSQDTMERPLSAPNSKASHSSEPSRRLVNGRRIFHGKGNSPSSSIINPEYINSYPEAIRATQRIQRRQQLQNTKANDARERKLYRSRTQPLTTKTRNAKIPMINTNPKVLLYDSHGEREGKRLLAKGDVVMINTALPNENGDKPGSHLFDVSGVVHYIGPLNEDETEIYIGIVLHEPVGDHDGKVEGRRYFKCQSPYGKLVKLIDIISILKHGGVTHNETL